MKQKVPLYKVSLRPATDRAHQFFSVDVSVLRRSELLEWGSIEYHPHGRLEAFTEQEARDFCASLETLTIEADVREKVKGIPILINGKEFIFDREVAHYEDIVRLALGQPVDGITVVWRSGCHSGTLNCFSIPVQVLRGMIFDAMATGNA